MIRYLFARVSLPLVFASIILADSYGAHLLPIPDRLRAIAAFAAAIIGSFAPGLYLKNRINKRVRKNLSVSPEVRNFVLDYMKKKH